MKSMDLNIETCLSFHLVIFKVLPLVSCTLEFTGRRRTHSVRALHRGSNLESTFLGKTNGSMGFICLNCIVLNIYNVYSFRNPKGSKVEIKSILN